MAIVSRTARGGGKLPENPIANVFHVSFIQQTLSNSNHVVVRAVFAKISFYSNTSTNFQGERNFLAFRTMIEMFAQSFNFQPTQTTDRPKSQNYLVIGKVNIRRQLCIILTYNTGSHYREKPKLIFPFSQIILSRQDD